MGMLIWHLRDYGQPGASGQPGWDQGERSLQQQVCPELIAKIREGKGVSHMRDPPVRHSDRGRTMQSYRYCLRSASMSALTLLIWERWDFSSSRSSSSRCAFFMASMAVWEGTGLACSAALPKGGVFWRFFKGTRTEGSQRALLVLCSPFSLCPWQSGKGGKVCFSIKPKRLSNARDVS